MSNLLQAEPEAVLALRTRAERCCLAFADEPLPPGCEPPVGRIGVEIDPSTGRSRLHIDRSIRYTGPSPEVSTWVENGTLTFASYDALSDWLRGPLRAAYQAPGATTAASAAGPSTLPDAVLIDPDALSNQLEEQVIGQTRAADQLSRAVALQLARLDPARPVTALAMGPTGVGKTLMAETVAKVLPGLTRSECEFIRLDMAEFQERHTVSRLFGAPPGYLGYGDDSRFLDALRSGKRVILLIDEIEKAHPDVFLALLNLMDAGRLTPAAGDAIDARHAVIIFTTNLAVDRVQEAVAGIDPDDVIGRDRTVRQVLRSAGIRPELVSRLHELLVFEPLAAQDLEQLITQLIEREAKTFGFDLISIAPEVLARMQAERPDPGSGARAWEHLISIRLGASFLAARRSGVPAVACMASDGSVQEAADA